MRKFQFTLERMMSYKEQIETSEKNKLAVLNGKQRDIEQLIEQMNEQTAALSREMNLKAQESGLSAAELSKYSFEIDNNRKYIHQLVTDLQNAKLSVEIQLRAVLRATQEVQGLEKLKEKQYDEFLKDEAKDQENVVSEFISSKLMREKNE